MIAARWLGLPPQAGCYFFCSPGSIGELAFEHNSREQPIIRVWNYLASPSFGPEGNQPQVR
jgi:probable phosphoglycerate mutase